MAINFDQTTPTPSKGAGKINFDKTLPGSYTPVKLPAYVEPVKKVEAPKTEEPKKGILRKVADFVTSFEQEGGKILGTAASVVDPETNKLRNETLDLAKKQADHYISMAKTETDKKRKEALLNAAKTSADTAGYDVFNNPEYQKTAKEIYGTFGGVALDAVTAGTFGKANALLKTGKMGKALPTVVSAFEKQGTKEVAKELGKDALKIGAPIGAGYGVASGMEQNQDLGGIAKSGALGATIGAGAQFAIGGVAKGLGSILGKKSPEIVSVVDNIIPEKQAPKIDFNKTKPDIVETPVLPNSQAQISQKEGINIPPKVENIAPEDPLIQEAKGKSLEEFIKEKTMYSGRSKKYDDISQAKGDNIFLTKNKDVAEYYGGEMKNVSEGFVDSSNFIDLSSQAKKAEYVKNNFTIEDIKKLYPDVTFRNGKETLTSKSEQQFYSDWLKELESEPFFSGEKQKLLLDKLKKDGYSGAILEDATMGIQGDKNSYVVLDKKALKTKSQLIDIWNKAQINQKQSTSRNAVEASNILKKMGEEGSPVATFSQKSRAEGAEEVARVVNGYQQNPDEVIKILRGEAPPPYHSTVFYDEISEYAQKNNDIQLLKEIANSKLAVIESEAAQTLGLKKNYEYDTVEIIKKIKKVNSENKKSAIAKDIQSYNNIKKAVKPTRQTWSEYVNSLRCK